VGERIAAVVADQCPARSGSSWCSTDPQVNAFAMPGGKVGVFSGLLKLVDSDDDWRR
jgi:predicted Zn-dependent protease